MEYMVEETTAVLTILDGGEVYQVTIQILAITIERARNQYSPQQIQDWSQDLRTVACKLDRLDKELANHFYNVHYAIGPEYLDESDIFELDEEYLELVAEQDKKRPQVVMQELIESLRVIISLTQNLWTSRCGIPV
jgi:hypothetical protein